MGISVFPAGGGEFITNDFVIDMNDTSNNVIDLGRTYAAGAYEISLASGDSSFDIYAVSEDGQSVGYTNDATLVTTGGFTQIAILGVAQDERITFSFSGASNDADSEGDATGAGAYLVSINPSDLPNQDDTANIIGGNFANDVEIYFESGTVSTQAKNVVRSDSTALVVTRPDALDPNLDPWDLRAVNPGVPEPTATNANILAGAVDAGATPVWITTSPLQFATKNTAYSATVVATDADGLVDYTITAGSLPSGLSLNSSTGVISGTPTTGSETFTIEATDEGGNSNSREFNLPVAKATGGTISVIGDYLTHIFTSSDDFVAEEEITNAEYLVISGGGGGGGATNNMVGGGGGAGGYRSSISGESSGGGASAESTITISAGTYAVTIGAGGNSESNSSNNGGSSSFGNLVTTVGGGGGGGGLNHPGQNGGSGGGGADDTGTGSIRPSQQPGTGTAGEGFDGAGGINDSGGGGGAGAAGGFSAGGAGVTNNATGSSVEHAVGGSGGESNSSGSFANTAGSGGGGCLSVFGAALGTSGQSGLVLVRYQ